MIQNISSNKTKKNKKRKKILLRGCREYRSDVPKSAEKAGRRASMTTPERIPQRASGRAPTLSPLLPSSPPLLSSSPLLSPHLSSLPCAPRLDAGTRCRSSSRRRQLLLSSKLLLSSPRRSSRRRHSSRCHHSSLAAFLSSTLFLSSPPTVPRTPFVSFPLRLPLLSSTPHLLDAAPSSHTPAPPPAPLAPPVSAARAAYVHMLLCIGLTVTVWYALEHAMYKRFAVRELMARVCSRMFLCVYDRERSGCPRPSVASIIISFCRCE